MKVHVVIVDDEGERNIFGVYVRLDHARRAVEPEFAAFGLEAKPEWVRHPDIEYRIEYVAESRWYFAVETHDVLETAE